MQQFDERDVQIYLFMYLFIRNVTFKRMQDTSVQSKSEWCNKTQ